ncbi:hypothetical protein Mp_8g06530 [Marchantia polymorpha subsp. ruderalis]|uniref:RRM domain-containing protein n=1 Tax=Marchantia polymorpha TaxID=3197 RepID=A0A2R6XIM9_MARPO|nr:hypothetical protein MARPO_0013s0137 [Marchantia polymorpha]BBN18912.1 hypothetical protein Mp_8g06530 [Marchantia polymorpha subsp. ruderalis]|eukprot:PTQ45932.1 hypothetical protein MARPO_0013s0137 [Marchantia polymorpha]
MASQENFILNMLQTVLEELKLLRAEFKVQSSTLIAAQYEIRELKLSQKSFEKIMVDISEHVDDIQEKVGSQASTAATPRLHEVVESLEVKMKSYAEAIKSAHISFCQEQEIENTNQFARRNNVRISGQPESDKEEVKSVVTKFLVETLDVPNADVAQALRIRTMGTQPRAIIVKFNDQTQRDTALANKAVLKGHRIWLDPDLTPLQAEARRKELAKVKEAQDAEFFAFLRDGQAIVTQRKRQSST